MTSHAEAELSKVLDAQLGVLSESAGKWDDASARLIAIQDALVNAKKALQASMEDKSVIAGAAAFDALGTSVDGYAQRMASANKALVDTHEALSTAKDSYHALPPIQPVTATNPGPLTSDDVQAKHDHQQAVDTYTSQVADHNASIDDRQNKATAAVTHLNTKLKAAQAELSNTVPPPPPPPKKQVDDSDKPGTTTTNTPGSNATGSNPVIGGSLGHSGYDGTHSEGAVIGHVPGSTNVGGLVGSGTLGGNTDSGSGHFGGVAEGGLAAGAIGGLAGAIRGVSGAINAVRGGGSLTAGNVSALSAKGGAPVLGGEGTSATARTSGAAGRAGSAGASEPAGAGSGGRAVGNTAGNTAGSRTGGRGAGAHGGSGNREDNKNSKRRHMAFEDDVWLDDDEIGPGVIE